MSYKLEVHGMGDPEGHYSSNALRFATFEEASRYGTYDLGSRWFGFDDSRVVESTDPVNYKFDEDSMSAIPVEG